MAQKNQNLCAVGLLRAQQLGRYVRHCGHSQKYFTSPLSHVGPSEGDSQKYFLHKITSPPSHPGHSEVDSLVAGQFFVPYALSQAESFKPSDFLVAGEFVMHCDSVIVGRVLQAKSNHRGPIASHPAQSWLH
jgi:hypothetical protein